MPNYSVTPKYGTAADVQNVATFLAQRQSDSGTTNGGIVANGNPPVPLIAQGGVNDANGLATAYLQGQADALLCSIGFQQESVFAFPTASTSGAFVDLVTVAFVAPVAKQYVAHLDFNFNATAGTTGAFRIGIGTTFGPMRVWYEPTAGAWIGGHVMCVAPCVAGVNTVHIQFGLYLGGGSVNTDGSLPAHLIITG